MITLIFENVRFEYDIRGLLGAFFPGTPIQTKILESGECTLSERIAYRYTRNLEEEIPEHVEKADYHEYTEEIRSLLEQQDAYRHGTGKPKDKKIVSGDAASENSIPTEEIHFILCVHLEDTLGKLALFTHKEIRKGMIRIKNAEEEKNQLKRLLYRMLSALCGGEMKPWGTLTGIRPVKLPMNLIEQGYTDAEISEHLKNTYLIGDEKRDLSIRIAHKEKALLDTLDYEDGYSMYVGIPFCPTTCLYCSFTSYPYGKWEARMGEYLEALEKELDYAEKAFAGKKLNTIYFGGGTPTTLSPEYLDRILGRITDRFDLSHLKEWTVEGGRPDSITPEKLEAIRRYPVDRISINPQTMKQETLDIIGRKHTVEQVKEAFHMAREAGFENINMDLIIGLPQERDDDVRHTMEEILKLDPDNLTVHTLAIKRASRLNMEKEQYGGLYLEHNTENMMRITAEGAALMGMEPYYLYRQKNMSGNLENIGYAREGKEGIYNILIMEEKQSIVALGAGSVSKRVDRQGDGALINRASNVKNVEQYIGRIDEMIERKRALYEG